MKTGGYRLCLRNTITSAVKEKAYSDIGVCCVASQFIQMEIQRPAVENTCTDVTHVSGMHKSGPYLPIYSEYNVHRIKLLLINGSLLNSKHVLKG